MHTKTLQECLDELHKVVLTSRRGWVAYSDFTELKQRFSEILPGFKLMDISKEGGTCYSFVSWGYEWKYDDNDSIRFYSFSTLYKTYEGLLLTSEQFFEEFCRGLLENIILYNYDRKIERLHKGS